jgi:hypothetical protein
LVFSSISCSVFYPVVKKKLDRGGISHPRRYYLKKSQNQTTLNPGLQSLTGQRQLPTLQQPPKPEGGEQDAATREQAKLTEEIFLIQTWKFAPFGNRTRDLRGATGSP